MKGLNCCRNIIRGPGLFVSVLFAVIAVFALALPGAYGQNITPPNLDVCDGVDACSAPNPVCKAGFDVTLTGFTPANTTNSGTATYTYKICSPPSGVCASTNTCNSGFCSNDSTVACSTAADCTLRSDESCLENSFCQTKGRQTDPNAYCTRDCAVDNFFGLSHFDVPLPDIIDNCVTTNTEVTGTCTANDNTPTDGHTASVGGFTTTDSSCFDTTALVAKCDSTDLNPGDCITMTVSIAGETNGLGVANAIVVDKESNVCTSACTQGPSCTPCEEEEGSACLTRTLGFWGTHPWITNDYAPVTVCGKTIGCAGTDPKGESNPACLAGSCTSIMEGLGSNPAELNSNQPYVAMIKQLTAAILNLNATAALLDGATCSSFTYNGKTIQEWIDFCNSSTMCIANKSTISNSGCIEALNAFNNSEDTGFVETPLPFERPSVDDYGNVSGADSTNFTAAQNDKIVIGQKINGGLDCRPVVISQ